MKKEPGVSTRTSSSSQGQRTTSHDSIHTVIEIGVFGFGRVHHHPYSPDLAPFDFAVFLETALYMLYLNVAYETI